MSIAIPTSTVGAISSYADLVDRIAAWMDRPDLMSRAPDFIALQEARLNRNLRVPEMETTADLMVTGGRAALPANCLQVRALRIAGTSGRSLSGMAPSALFDRFGGREGCPDAYAIVGREIMLAPAPASSTSLSIAYWRSIPALSSAQTTNWLLDEHPDIYLYGALAQAEAYLANDERVVLWKAAHDEAVGEMVRAGERARYGAGPLIPTTVRQTWGARC